MENGHRRRNRKRSRKQRIFRLVRNEAAIGKSQGEKEKAKRKGKGRETWVNDMDEWWGHMIDHTSDH